MTTIMEIRATADKLQRPFNGTREERVKWLEVLIEHDDDSRRPHHFTSSQVSQWANLVNVRLLQRIENGRELLELSDDELLQRVSEDDRERARMRRRNLFNDYIDEQLPTVNLSWTIDAQEWYIELCEAFQERDRQMVVTILKRGLTIRATDKDEETVVVKVMWTPFVQTRVRRLIGSKLTHYFAWSDRIGLTYDEE